MQRLFAALPDLQPAERGWEVTPEDAPEIIMSIQDQFTTVFTCTGRDCNWELTASGVPINAEHAALEHLRKSHSQSWDGGAR